MKTIKTRVDDATYATLVQARKKAGLPTVSALFLKNCDVLDDQLEAAEIVRRGLQRAKKQASEDAYLLSDLFGKADWTAFSKGARIRAGKLFFEEVSAATMGIRTDGKTSSGHQLYVTT